MSITNILLQILKLIGKVAFIVFNVLLVVSFVVLVIHNNNIFTVICICIFVGVVVVLEDIIRVTFFK